MKILHLKCLFASQFSTNSFNIHLSTIRKVKGIIIKPDIFFSIKIKSHKVKKKLIFLYYFLRQQISRTYKIKKNWIPQLGKKE